MKTVDGNHLSTSSVVFIGIAATLFSMLHVRKSRKQLEEETEQEPVDEYLNNPSKILEFTVRTAADHLNDDLKHVVIEICPEWYV